MAYQALKETVWRANLNIVEAGLVVLTWGNASGADREAGVMAIKPSGLDPGDIPGVLVAGHGPFAWGTTPQKAVENAIVLESVARMALHTYLANPQSRPIDPVLLDKHFLRKHGTDAYYGQD